MQRLVGYVVDDAGDYVLTANGSRVAVYEDYSPGNITVDLYDTDGNIVHDENGDTVQVTMVGVEETISQYIALAGGVEVMTVKVQSHIHIGDTLDTDNAPLYKFKVQQEGYSEIPYLAFSLLRSATGAAYYGVALDDAGAPIIREDKSISILCTRAEYEVLKTLYARDMKFVPHTHPDNGEDHADYVLDVVVSPVGEARPLGFDLARYVVPISITLRD